MEQELKFVVTFSKGDQITEDQWRRVRPTLNVTSDTTIKEIYEWYRKKEKTGEMNVELIQTEIV